MIKRITAQDPAKTTDADQDWLDLNNLVQVEVSSEDSAHPIESALLLRPQSKLGWRAAESGPQTVRILFDQPQRIKDVYLEWSGIKERSYARVRASLVIERRKVLPRDCPPAI
ncbi:MAG: hypothetical protein ACTHMB_14635 [Candidatus Binatia bacterium]